MESLQISQKRQVNSLLSVGRGCQGLRITPTVTSFVVAHGRDVVVIDDGGLTFVSEYPLGFALGIDFQFIAESHARNAWDHLCGEKRLLEWRKTIE